MDLFYSRQAAYIAYIGDTSLINTHTQIYIDRQRGERREGGSYVGILFTVAQSYMLANIKNMLFPSRLPFYIKGQLSETLKLIFIISLQRKTEVSVMCKGLVNSSYFSVVFYLIVIFNQSIPHRITFNLDYTKCPLWWLVTILPLLK